MIDLQPSEPLVPSLERGPEASSGRTFSASARLTLVQNRFFSRNSVAVAIAVAIVLALGVVVANSLVGSGDWDISSAGWVAMGFGVTITLALGVGLMALIFISSRRGFDELAGGNNKARSEDGDDCS